MKKIFGLLCLITNLYSFAQSIPPPPGSGGGPNPESGDIGGGSPTSPIDIYIAGLFFVAVLIIYCYAKKSKLLLK